MRNALENRQFGFAGYAPGGPIIDNHRPANQLGELIRLPVHSLQDEFRRPVTDLRANRNRWIDDWLGLGRSRLAHCGCLLRRAGWLRQGSRVRELVIEKTGLDEEGLQAALRSRERRAQLLRATERAMVVQHLSNLMTYPLVAEKVEDAALNLHGWYYALESGEIERYDPERLAFLPLQRPSIGLPAPDAS